MGELRKVAISDIRENPVALRAVNRESEEYQGLVDSIRQKGFLGAITGRPQEDEDGTITYELIDGLHRYCAAKDAGLEEINMDVVSLDDDAVLEAQIMANIHKVETKPMEYTKQLKRILTRNPMMTESELAAKLGKSPAWIAGRLSLNRLTGDTMKTLVNEGKVCLSNAYALAKLPPEEQADWLDRAQTLPPDEFIPATAARLKEIREARRKGKDAAPAEFQPVPHLQKLKTMKEELETNAMGQMLCEKHGPGSMVEGFALAIAWTLHMDPDSVEAQKVKDEERKKERAEKKKKRDAEKAAKKAEKLKKELAEATAMAEKASEEVAG
jgi:ParB/RepB/Spo0J family partition protein